jgi:hypothetical protein
MSCAAHVVRDSSHISRISTLNTRIKAVQFSFEINVYKPDLQAQLPSHLKSL